MSTRAFRHTDDGTSESDWLTARAWDDVPSLDLDALAGEIQVVVVASAHPDDETLSVGGLISELRDRSVEVRIIAATDGESSHPNATTMTPRDLANLRRCELEEAIRILGATGDVTYLGLPDGSLLDRVDTLVDCLTPLLSPTSLLIAPWTLDGHADHDALGAAAEIVSARTNAPLLHYPLWWWHWAQPDELPWERMIALPLPPATLARKHQAVREHRSQCEPLGPCPGDAPVLTAPVLARADRPFETFIWPSPDHARWQTPRVGTDSRAFDAMYDRSRDPWGFADSPYEKWKRGLLLALLRRPLYGHILEIGCADGQTSAALSTRADHVTAMDVSAEAIQQAKTQDLPTVRWVHGCAPTDLPEGRFDLIVLSEVLYFLHPLDAIATLRICQERLADGGEIVLVDWQHPSRTLPLSGQLVHELAAQVLYLPHHCGYRDRDVRIDIWGGPPSLAHEEGRV